MDKTDLLDMFYENMATMKRVMRSRMETPAGSCSLTHSQMALLFSLREYQPISPKSLASRMFLSPGAVSQLAEGLVEQKLIERTTDPSDRRSQILKVTRSGNAKLRQIEKYRHKYLKEALEDLSMKELIILLKVQKKIISRFSEPEAAAHTK